MAEFSPENIKKAEVIEIETKLSRLCNDIKDEVNDSFKKDQTRESLYIKFEIRNNIAHVQVFDNGEYVYDCYSTTDIGKLAESKGKNYIVKNITSAISNWVSDGKPILRKIAKDVSKQQSDFIKTGEASDDFIKKHNKPDQIKTA